MSLETKQKKSINVSFFGDSICVGQGVAIHKGWVTRISARLSNLAQEYGRDVVVINSSVSGSTTRQALERMPYHIQSQEVDVLIVQFGMNDCNCWITDRGCPRVSPKAFEANLEEIIQRAFTFGAHLVLLNTNHPTGRDQEVMPYTNVTYQQQNALYNEIIRKVSKIHPKVILNDVEVAFMRKVSNDRNKLLSLLLPDQLHLSEKAHDLYFEIMSGPLYAIVEELLRDEA